MKNRILHPRLFALLALTFVLSTIIGAVSHEMGHIAAAKSFGYKTKLHYAAASFAPEKDVVFDSLYKADSLKIIAQTPSPEKQRFEQYRTELREKRKHEEFIISLAGPLQTMLTGTIGILILYLRRKKITAAGMKGIDWLAVFLALFWSRQLANFILVLLAYFMFGDFNHFGDEEKISHYLNLYPITINLITGIPAALILLWTVFVIIPKQQRFTFIIAGLAGSALGWMVWMEWIGPVLLP
jgi:hypothetical protein